MFKKIIFLIIIISILNSCLLIKIKKDSEPLIDFGVPLIGHFRNGDIPKAVFYTVSFALSCVGIILFSPSQGDANEIKAIIPVERSISDPILFAFTGTAVSSLVGSSIDTAVTYNLINDKIMDLNNIKWDRDWKKTKYQVICDFREKQEEIETVKHIEKYREEIEYYRKKLITGTITEDEINFLERVPSVKEQLEKELGYYYINQDLKKNKNKK